MPAQLILVDGFDIYSSTALFGRRWAVGSSSFGFTSPGRFGAGRNLWMATSDYSATAVFNNNVAPQAFRISAAVNLNQSYFNNSQAIIGVADSLTRQVGVGVDQSCRLNAYRASTTLIGSSNKWLRPFTWHHIEMYVVISNSIGVNQCVVRVNNEEWINVAAGTSTRATANNSATMVYLNCMYGSISFDDVIVWSEDVTNSPTWLGDMRVQTLYPTGNGNYSQFVGSDGNSVDNYALVNEATINDANYVGSLTAGHRDSYPITDLASTTTAIKGVQIHGQLYRSDAGPRTGKLFTRINSTDYDGVEISPASSAAASYIQIFENSPETATAWTINELNNTEAGVKVQS